jgi:hypothetical protein
MRVRSKADPLSANESGAFLVSSMGLSGRMKVVLARNPSGFPLRPIGEIIGSSLRRNGPARDEAKMKSALFAILPASLFVVGFHAASQHRRAKLIAAFEPIGGQPPNASCWPFLATPSLSTCCSSSIIALNGPHSNETFSRTAAQLSGGLCPDPRLPSLGLCLCPDGLALVHATRRR